MTYGECDQVWCSEP